MRADAARRIPALWPILAVSLLVRLELARRGGQFYWPDEQNYLAALRVLELVGRGEAQQALELLLRITYHTGWVVVGLAPMGLQLALGGTRGLAALGAESFWLSAGVLSAASVGCIGMTHALARRLGAGRGEAALAALLTACSSGMLYFSRHLLPYDVSMLLALLAAWVGLRERAGPARTWACGLLAGAAFFTYYGHWTIALLAVGLHLAWTVRSARDLIVRSAIAGLALAALPLTFTAASVGLGLPPFLAGMGEFAGTITQGTYAEGWSLPWAYLWTSEGTLLVAWLGGSALVARAAWREGWRAHVRGLTWLAAALAVWAALALASTGLERFVVYGRLARQMVPFLGLAAAYGVTRLPRPRSAARWAIAGTALGLLLLHAGVRFTAPLGMSFPRQAQRRALAEVGPVACAATVRGNEFTCERETLSRGPAPPRFVLLNAHILYPVTGEAPAPAGREVWRLPHPESYRPYGYEGYTPLERSILERADISMRLIETGPSPGG